MTMVAVIVSLALSASHTGCHLKYSGLSQRRCSPHEEMLSAVKEGEIYFLNRHAQIVDDSRIVLKVTLRTQKSNDATMQISIKRAP
jgi:hypothetical protein